MNKICIKCGIEKSIAELVKRKDSKNGFRSICKVCTNSNFAARRKLNPDKYNSQTKAWRKANPEKVVDIALNTRFGITLDQYEQMLKSQNGLCALCKQSTSNMNRRLAVDHDHKTGKVRGLLCFNCNTSLSKFENEEYFDRVMSYLDRPIRILSRAK